MQEPVAQFLRFRAGEVTVQEQGLGSGRCRSARGGEPGLVGREDAGRESAEAGVLAAADAVLDVGVSAVAGLQVLDRSRADGGCRLSVATTWCRQPSTVSNKVSWAPGCGRSRRTRSRVPVGHPAASMRPVISQTSACWRRSPSVSTAGTQPVAVVMAARMGSVFAAPTENRMSRWCCSRRDRMWARKPWLGPAESLRSRIRVPCRWASGIWASSRTVMWSAVVFDPGSAFA